MSFPFITNDITLTSPVEAQHLTDALFACDNAEVTYSGKRIVSLIGMDELDKKF